MLDSYVQVVALVQCEWRCSVAWCGQLCPGGGFGPVSDDGYGVSYMVPGDASLYFHVSSKHSSSATDSARFTRLLFESLHDIRQLFADVTKNKRSTTTAAAAAASGIVAW